jgi:uncharacterized protein YegP (UPF0339 family)
VERERIESQRCCQAENGEIVAASQGYSTKQSAEKGIAVIKRIAAETTVADLTIEH